MPPRLLSVLVSVGITFFYPDHREGPSRRLVSGNADAIMYGYIRESA